MYHNIIVCNKNLVSTSLDVVTNVLFITTSHTVYTLFMFCLRASHTQAISRCIYNCFIHYLDIIGMFYTYIDVLTAFLTFYWQDVLNWLWIREYSRQISFKIDVFHSYWTDGKHAAAQAGKAPVSMGCHANPSPMS